MSDVLDTVILLALPASGKSEVRRYLAHQPEATAAEDFHMGPTVQLDDFPYVHMMRRTDDALVELGHPRTFFEASDRPFIDAREWGTLVHLLNEDYADLRTCKVAEPVSAAGLLLARFDAAAAKVGISARLSTLPEALRRRLEANLEDEARAMLVAKHEAFVESLEGKTVVIEFARGGVDGADMPLSAPFGYAYSLAQLSTDILRTATVLYIWVSPEESRRKNAERTDPNDPGSILNHGVPIDVLLNDYGCDDMQHLCDTSDRPGTIALRAHGGTFHLPVARFDNRTDKTTFIRKEPAEWTPDEVAAVHEGLGAACGHLAELRLARSAA